MFENLSASAARSLHHPSTHDRQDRTAPSARDWKVAEGDQRHAAHAPPPIQQLAQMVTGYWVSAAIYAAAKLGIADLLKDGPRTSDSLAAATGTDTSSLYRLLRALASVGIFTETEPHRFDLTPIADLLRSDHPAFQRAFAIFMGEEMYRAYGDLLDSVRTGRSAYEKFCGMPVFQYLAQHPDKAAIFDQAMTGIHGRETGGMLESYDFSGIGTLADVGGGNGSLLCAILARYPKLQGMLCELPHVIERARRSIEAAGLGGRCRLIPGSFFDAVPAGADAYLMRHVIHDYDDEQAVTILRNTRQALPAGGKVLVVEGVIEPGNGPALTKLLDLTMLVAPGGRERTEAEYRELFSRAGLRISRIVPTRADVSVIEAVAE